jgi:O-antigen/teichoic acid export membrane protein
MRLRFTIASVDEKVKNFFKNTALSSLMYFFSGLFISVSSVVILKLFDDTHFLAEYQVVVKSVFFSLVAVLVYPLNSFAFPHISQLAAQKNCEEIVRIEKKLLLYLGALLAMLSAATFLTRPAIELVFPQEYAGSYRYLNVLLPFLVFLAYTTFALNILKGFNRFDLALYVRMGGCGVFFVALGIMYMAGEKAESVLYAMDIAFVFMALLAFYLKRRIA